MDSKRGGLQLCPAVVPFYPFLGEGSPTKIDYRKKGALILTTGGPRQSWLFGFHLQGGIAGAAACG